MGSEGMPRKGRRHLPKVPGYVSGPLGFQYGAFTFPGLIERAGSFATGLRADSRDSQRRFRALGLVFFAVLVGFLLIVLIAFGWP